MQKHKLTFFFFGIFFLLFAAYLYAQTVAYTCKVSNVKTHQNRDGFWYEGTYTEVRTDSIICISCHIPENIAESLTQRPETLATLERFPNKTTKLGFYISFFVGVICLVIALGLLIKKLSDGEYYP